MLLYGNLANPSSLFAYVKAGATTACVSMYVFWMHACVLIPKTRFCSNHVSKTLYPKTERILQVRACRNFRGSFEHRNCAIVHVHLELRLQHWKIFGYVTTPYPTAYISTTCQSFLSLLVIGSYFSMEQRVKLDESFPTSN